MALFSLPVIRATDANGNTLSGAKLYFYRSETLEPADVYTTSEMDTAHENPVVADAGGLFPAIYLDGGITYRMILKTSADITVQDIDPYQGSVGGGATSVSVRIEDFGGVADYNRTTNTGTDNTQALLDAIDSFTFYPEFETIAVGPNILFGSGAYYFAETINLKKIVGLIGTGAGQNNFVNGTRFYFPEDTTGIIVNRQNTDGATYVTPATGAADGSVIRGIQLVSAGGTDTGAHGIWLRARANVEYCTIGEYDLDDLTEGFFPGNGIHIVANSGSTDDLLHGNANNCFLLHNYIEYVGRHGLYVSGTDANAHTIVGFETRKCGGCGVLDISGLGGSSYSGLNIAGYANATPLLGRVTQGGRHYQLIDSTAGIGASTTPGTNENVWYDMGTGSSWPAWSGAGTYTPDIPIMTDGDSNRCVFTGIYTEGGTSHIPAPSVAIGGQAGYTKTSAVIHASGIGVVNGLFTQQGIGTYNTYGTGAPGAATNGTYAYTLIGGPNADVTYGVNFLEHRRQIDGATSWFWAWNAQKDQYYAFGANKNVWRITGPNTTTTFGRSAAVPYMFGAAGIGVIDASNLSNSRLINISTAAPATGDRAAGELVLNVAPGTGGNMGWSCTTGHATTGGTWYKTGSLFLDGSATFDPGSIANGAQQTTTVTVTGAALGDFVEVSFSNSLGGLFPIGYVSAADTVTAGFGNVSGGAVDLASGTLRVRVTKKP